MHNASRRRFIDLVGKAAGAGAAYRVMVAMGLLREPEAYAGPPKLPAGSGAGVSVLVLGAGIAGLVAAYELSRAGYRCLVLEARSRAGGRNWTLRRGDVFDHAGATQRVTWDAGPHMYFNAGPARIAYHHRAILGYCRELRVPLEVMVNDNRGAFLQDDSVFGGERQSARAVVNDARGFIAELAAKAVRRESLDAGLSREDRERLGDLLGFIVTFGDLEAEGGHYLGSWRSGYAIHPGAGHHPGRPRAPIDPDELFAAKFRQYKMHWGELFNQSATMFQPVGGMDRIVAAFTRVVGSRIRYNARVTEIMHTAKGVRVIWEDSILGIRRVSEAPYAICTIPLTVLARIRNNFAPKVRAAIASLDYMPAGKIAFEGTRRFWELDEEIYGGISWTERDITQMWYPSAGIHQQKGILVGGYIWDAPRGHAFAAKTPAQRIADALADGEALHPNYRAWVTKGISVAWSKVPFSEGAWGEWTDPRPPEYATLVKGDGAVLFAGEHMSYLPAWQEGAALSAQDVVKQIGARVRAKRA
jgi:monoamine oxidase